MILFVQVMFWMYVSVVIILAIRIAVIKENKYSNVITLIINAAIAMWAAKSLGWLL